MPFEIVRNDITKMAVDAIVNSANPRPVVGLGTDSMIHAAAGPELLAARKKIGPITAGNAAITPAYNLQARYVIHTVGPVWDGGTYGEAQLLRSCYDSSLKLALAHGCKSIAFPLISTNNYGFPKDKALQIAVAAFSAFLLEHEMQIYLVVFDRTAFRLSEKLFHSVASYIDQHYVDNWVRTVYGPEGSTRQQQLRRRRDRELYEASMVCDEALPAPCAPKAIRLEDLLKQADCGFSERLIQLLNQSGLKNAAVYKKAQLSKQHFSKILSNPSYQPTKPTAIALALALELDLDGVQDLIGRAGYTLTNSSKFDLIIRYCIEHKEYNIVQINAILYEFDQSLLGQ
ncbi:MAG: macro domain-containing protein [Oscillospiraceae bacterium]|nr:macro domain-containing protein [Oscillospiraceae bacterium]